MRQGSDAVDKRLARLPGLEHLRLGGADGLLEAVGVADGGDLLEPRAGARPYRRPAGLRSDAVDRGLDDDVQQALAIEVGGEGLADAPHRVLQARALLVELLQALGELARHLVELLAERGELVMAGRRHLGREVARTQAARGLEERLDLALQRARHEQGEGEGEDEEADEDAGGEQATLPHVGGLLHLRREDGDLGLGPQKVGFPEGGCVVGPVAHLDLAAVCGEVGRIDARDRRGEHRPAHLLDHRLPLGHPPDEVRVVGRELLRDLKLSVRALAAEKVALGREDRGRDADIDERPAAARDGDPLDALLCKQFSRARLQRGVVATAQRLGELRVRRDRLRSAIGLGVRLVVEVRGRGEVGGQPRLGLPTLVVSDQPEEDERDRHHRDDDDEDEEQRQPVAEAHAPRRRTIAAPAAGRSTKRLAT